MPGHDQVDRLRASACLIRALEKIEIFVLLPRGGLIARTFRVHIRQPFLEPSGLIALELEVVVDEHLSEILAEQRGLLERGKRVRQRLRQPRPVGRIGIVIGCAGIELVLDAVEAGGDLRRDVEIRVGGRFSDAIFQPGGRI